MTDHSVESVIKELKALGNEATKASHIKHCGATEQNQFGVKMGDIRALAKSIKTNEALARDLWATELMEPQLIATLIIKPKALSLEDMRAWGGSISCVQVAAWFNNYLAKKHANREDLCEIWMQSEHPMEARLGWEMTASTIEKTPDVLDHSALLDRLEQTALQAHPDTQWTMNNTLAAIGINDPSLRSRALSLGEKLGLFRDYPTPKGCTSPFAPLWINEMVRRQEEAAA